MKKDLLILIVLVFGIALGASGFYFYESDKKDIIYTVDTETLLKIKSKEIKNSIVSGTISDSRVAKQQLKKYTEKIRSVVFEKSRELKKPIYDKRAVISIYQQDLTNEIFKRLQR